MSSLDSSVDVDDDVDGEGEEDVAEERPDASDGAGDDDVVDELLDELRSESETLVRNLPIDETRKPRHDVRSSRSDAGISDIADSIERSGQIHAAFVYPVPPQGELRDPDWLRLDLAEKLDRADGVRVVDGWTRRQALKSLNRETIRCEIHHVPPENTSVVSLEANTKRLDMSDFETVRALKEMAERRGLTHREVAEEVGKSRSHITNLFKLLEAPDFVRDAWEDEESVFTASHIAVLLQLPGEEEYARMLRYIQEHELSVKRSRTVVQERLKMLQRREAEARRSGNPRQAGASEAAAGEDVVDDDAEPEVERCRLTGDPKFAVASIPVSEQMYGLIQQAREQDSFLLEQLGIGPEEDGDG
jgi:ParB/RepB/Spo0J family partition protein